MLRIGASNFFKSTREIRRIPWQGQGNELAPRTQGAVLRDHAPLLAEARGGRWQLEKTADENSEVILSRQMNSGAG